MKRMCLVGAVVAAVSLAFGATGSVAAGKHKKKKTTVTVSATCKLVASVSVPAGDTEVTPPAQSGHEFGTVACGKAGRGVYANSFVLQDSGDLTGKYTQYYGPGAIHGTFDLAQSDNSGPPTAYDFGNENLVGTFTVKGGAGAYAKARGKGTLVCQSLDSVHYSCVEKLKVKLPVKP